jgi:hypothetical protein
MPITLDGTLGITTPALTVTGATVNTGGISTGGNLTFTTTGSRITGDMSNATATNRLAFQSSTTNGASILNLLPNGTSTTAYFAAFNNSDPTNASTFQLLSGPSDNRLNSNITGTGTYNPMTFYTGGSERMRIDTSGNVGIGTTNPTSHLMIASTTSSDVQLLVAADNGSGAGGGIVVTYGGASASSPRAKLSISSYSGVLDLYDQSNNLQTHLTANGSSYFTNGNVGIGTSSPGYTLDVNGTGHVSTSFYIGTNVVGGTFQSVGGSGNTTHYFASYDSNNTAISIVNIPGSQKTLIASQWNSTATALAFGLASSEYMRVHTNGYVGIGTSSPTYTLQVAGNAYTNQSVRSGNNIIITSTDLNSLINAGSYTGYNLTNAPSAAGGSGSTAWCFVEVLTNGSDQVFQRATPAQYQSNSVWNRMSTNGGTSWGSWLKESGTGGVIQTLSTAVSNRLSINVASAFTYYNFTGLSVTITPSTTSSKILVFFQTTVGNSDTGATAIQITRNGTPIGNGSGGTVADMTSNWFGSPTYPTYTMGAMVGQYLDSPASTSALTYQVQVTNDGTGNVYFNGRGADARYQGTSTITVMEIAQ